MVCHTAYELFYSSIGQHTSIGNYWNDPHHQGLYRNYSRFLPYINNEVLSSQSNTYKYGITKLRKLILIGGPDDGVITPWQSRWVVIKKFQFRLKYFKLLKSQTVNILYLQVYYLKWKHFGDHLFCHHCRIMVIRGRECIWNALRQLPIDAIQPEKPLSLSCKLLVPDFYCCDFKFTAYLIPCPTFWALLSINRKSDYPSDFTLFYDLWSWESVL